MEIFSVGIVVVTGEPKRRHEVDSNFFELLTLYPPANSMKFNIFLCIGYRNAIASNSINTGRLNNICNVKFLIKKEERKKIIQLLFLEFEFRVLITAAKPR